MIDDPTAQEIADALGVLDWQITTYLTQCSAFAEPHKWMLTFSPDTPDDLRKKMKLNKALVRVLVIPPRRVLT